MQCSCGGTTSDHVVVQHGEIAGKFAECSSCGRTTWWFDNREILDHRENEKI